MSNNNTSSGVGMFGVIFIVFAVLKWLEVHPVAQWSWWWVTSPLWIPACVAFTIWALVEIVQGIARMFKPGWKD